MKYASFKSIGAYIPDEIRSNQWFVDRMDTSDIKQSTPLVQLGIF